MLCLDHILRALEDDEFHQHSSAWPAGMTLVDMTLTIKGMVWRLLRGDMTLPSESNIAGTAMTVNTFRVVVLRLFKSLYQRNTRRPFMADDQWLAGFDIIPHDINNSLIDVVSVWVGTETSAVNVRSMPVKTLLYAFSFFNCKIKNNRIKNESFSCCNCSNTRPS